MHRGKKRWIRSAVDGAYGWRAVFPALAGLMLTLALLASQVAVHQSGVVGRRKVQAWQGPYLYYVLKDAEGFVLARAREGFADQPAERPEALIHFGGDFGQTTADAVLTLQLSPDGRYLAIDGTRSDCELVWVFDTSQLTLRQLPAVASGSFLRWLPGPGETFLFRPMFPFGPDAPLDRGEWHPGLWKVDATTGRHTNLDIQMSSAFLIDAIASPDGKTIIYSTTEGLGQGSTIWSMDANGQRQTRLMRLSDSAQSIAGMFAWSPDGQTLAYERLADSPTPFLPAAIWTMHGDGTGQHYLTEGDGGHGFALSWAPDSSSIAFVSRTNLDENQANLRSQALQSAVEEVDVRSGKVRYLAGPVQTGVQINADPVWNANSSAITFLAFNPLNPESGGSLRYWSVDTAGTTITPAAQTLTTSLTRIIAFQ